MMKHISCVDTPLLWTLQCPYC